jgi:hypothetical protein
VVAQPILRLREVNRCYSGANRRARIHITRGIAMGSAEGVVTEVDSIVEAHQKRIRVSGTLVSMDLYVEHNVSITISR